MRREDLPNELLELLHQSGIDVDTLPAELTDQELEAVVGGKQRIGNRMGEAMLGGMRAVFSPLFVGSR
jgi:hypothetical protein